MNVHDTMRAPGPLDGVAGFEAGETILLTTTDITIDGTVADANGNLWWRISRAFWETLVGAPSILGGGWGELRYWYAPQPGAGVPLEERALALSTRVPTGLFWYSLVHDLMYPGDSIWIGSSADAIYLLERPGTLNGGADPPPAWSLAAIAAGAGANELGIVLSRRSFSVPK